MPDGEFNELAAKPHKSKAHMATISSETILIIEDNPFNMELAADLLDIAGYRILTAINAEEGLVLAAEAVPDLILMDIALPGMDGLTAIEVLRDDLRTAGIKVVVLSAHAMKGDEERARAAGGIGYITKPINTREFINTVSGFLAIAKDLERAA